MPCGDTCALLIDLVMICDVQVFSVLGFMSVELFLWDFLIKIIPGVSLTQMGLEHSSDETEKDIVITGAKIPDFKAPVLTLN